MPNSPRPRPVVLLGPTAGGKSRLAADLALALRGHVIGADSMQVYRHMDAGTAKPPPQLRRLVPHHLIDIVEPTQRFTVADWLERADHLINQLTSQGLRPIIVGGTNLYLKALLEGMFTGPSHDPALRARLAALPGDELHDRLQRVDPEAADRIHANDRKKLIRAIEVFEQTGRPISALQTQWAPTSTPTPTAGLSPPSSPELNTGLTPATNMNATNKIDATATKYHHDPILIGLTWHVDAINHRINQRVKRMFYPELFEHRPDDDATRESLPREVARLESAQLLGPQAREALGYKQVLQHLAGTLTLDDAFEQTKILTRRFAKTQRTWLKRFRGVRWLNAENTAPESLRDKALASVFAEENTRDGFGAC